MLLTFHFKKRKDDKERVT